MPTSGDLAKIASALYVGNPSIGSTSNVSSLTYAGNASEYGLPEPYFRVWSGQEYRSIGSYAYNRNFYPSYTNWGGAGRNGSSGFGLCLGD